MIANDRSGSKGDETIKKKITEKKKILVKGDAAIDWFDVSTPLASEVPGIGSDYQNWQTYPEVCRFSRPGGVFLLAEFIREAAGDNCEIICPEAASSDPVTRILSFAEISSFPFCVAGKKPEIFRLKRWKGFAVDRNPKPVSQNISPNKNSDSADIIVFDDAGNGFRDAVEFWESALSNENALLVLKMSRPLGKGKLWERLTKRNPLVLIVDVDDLRMMNVKISRCLSWERTAQDFAWQLAYNQSIDFLRKPDYLVMRLGGEGAVLCKNRENPENRCKLFFDSEVGEDMCGSIYPGKMGGIGNAFTAALVAELVGGSSEENIDKGVRKAVCSMKNLWKHGFGTDVNKLDYQYENIFNHSEETGVSAWTVPVPKPDPEQDYWCIINDLNKEKCLSFENAALDFVRKGGGEGLQKAPHGRFGKLVTMIRSEIESYNSVKILVNEYINSPKINHPLCIGVFGPPGSGKSFGVTAVVKSLAPGKVGSPLQFNLSQFSSLNDLIAAFHQIRDIALEGLVPLVFFDEFDSEFDGIRLGWLKYFLAPMQDGVFREVESMHPLGKAILVFAGGTCSTFNEFSNQKEQYFKAAKGTDFVSRLRGYINIQGFNPGGDDIIKEPLVMIKRATVLRSLLKKHAPHIFKKLKEGDICQIDEGILHAFIKVPKYKHGLRSMQSIIEMSMLAGRSSYEQSALPSLEQLELHVNAEAFHKIVIRKVIFSAAREKIAKAIHEKYIEDSKAAGREYPPGGLGMAPWADLRDDFKISNLEQADHILNQLKIANCDFLPVADREVKLFEFNKENIEKMAMKEHERFKAERIRQGWKQGEERNDAERIRTDLVDWKSLPEKVRDQDRDAVRAIPQLLKKAGLEIYSLE